METKITIESGNKDFLWEFNIFRQYLTALKILDKSEEVDLVKIYIFKHTLELGVKLLLKNLSGEKNKVHDLQIIKNRLLEEINKLSKDSLSGRFVINDSLTHYLNEFGNSNNINVGGFINYIKEIKIEEIVGLCDRYQRDDDKHSTRYRYSNDTITYNEKKDILDSIKKDIETLDKMYYLFYSIFLSGIKHLRSR